MRTRARKAEGEHNDGVVTIGRPRFRDRGAWGNDFEGGSFWAWIRGSYTYLDMAPIKRDRRTTQQLGERLRPIPAAFLEGSGEAEPS